MRVCVCGWEGVAVGWSLLQLLEVLVRQPEATHIQSCSKLTDCHASISELVEIAKELGDTDPLPVYLRKTFILPVAPNN